MVTSSDVSVLIGNPVNGEAYTISNECILASGYGSSILRSDLFLLTTLDHSGAIIEFKADSQLQIKKIH